MSSPKYYCSQWDCDPVITGIGAWKIFVCSTCKQEITESLYDGEMKRKPAPQPVDWGTDLDNYD